MLELIKVTWPEHLSGARGVIVNRPTGETANVRLDSGDEMVLHTDNFVSLLSEAARREVETLATQALWYAWGRIDSGVYSGPDTDYAFAFRDWYQELAARYAEGVTFTRPSIMGEWERWLSAGRIG